MTKNVTDHPYREFERSGWELAASNYSESFEGMTSLYAPHLFDATGVKSGSRVLDVACGPGPIAAAAAVRGATVTGIDFSPNMIAEARRRHPSLHFQEGDAEALPFEDESFDAVVINFGVHHFPFPLQALSEGHRVLKPSSRIAFTTWASPKEHVIHRILVDALRRAGDTGANLPVPPTGGVNEAATCIKLLKDAGFQTASLRTEDIKVHMHVETAERFVAMLKAGTVRMAATLKPQPPDRGAAILSAIEESLSEFRANGGYKIPWAAILAVGEK